MKQEVEFIVCNLVWGFFVGGGFVWLVLGLGCFCAQAEKKVPSGVLETEIS